MFDLFFTQSATIAPPPLFTLRGRIVSTVSNQQWVDALRYGY